tara:strand:+ start:115 stop:942 length:828 start_codon:yes stop_codon:yes gene_type:complete
MKTWTDNYPTHLSILEAVKTTDEELTPEALSNKAASDLSGKELKNAKHFDLLCKRKHVITYKRKAPPKWIIERALKKAWRVQTSKQNMFAYKVIVYGPEHQKWKDKIWGLSNKNQYMTDRDHTARDDIPVNITRDAEKYPNSNYNHVRHNPWLFAFHSRLSEPNKFYQAEIDNGSHTADERHPQLIEKIIDHTALEVGMFAANLSSFLLEEGLDVSYNICFIRDVEEWKTRGFEHVTRRPILMMSCGYADKYRKDHFKNLHNDVPQPYEHIVKFL